MAYDGWIEFGGVEVVNLSRTAQLAITLGIDTVWTQPEEVDWIQAALGGADYHIPVNAPWYNPSYPASAEFAGIIPLEVDGLGNSSFESTPVEYVTDGGNTGRARNATLSIVANVAIVAATSRGAEFGKRWLDHTLRHTEPAQFCYGSTLRYFRYRASDSELVPKIAHRQNVALTRGTSITRQRESDCSATWLATFTWTAGDPYEYGEAELVLEDLGGTATGPNLLGSGTELMAHETCPKFDYSPIYDPLYPALIEPPEAPDFYPDGWNLGSGTPFTRYWAKIGPVEPAGLDLVPTVLLTTDEDARMVRVAIWDSALSAVTDHCDPLWMGVVSYLPADMDFYIDGERQAVYVWDQFSPEVRRTDSLLFGPDAEPADWGVFSSFSDLFVTLDVFDDQDGNPQGDGTVRMALSLTPKSD